MAEDYGRRVGMAVARLAGGLKTGAVTQFTMVSKWVDLPPHQGAPDFVKIAGDEYHVTQEQLDMLLPMLFPSKAPIYGLRIGDLIDPYIIEQL